MAGTAAKIIVIICCQLHVMNQSSHCHKETQMKPRWPNSDARNGVTAEIARQQVQSQTCPRAAEFTEWP